MSEEEIDDLIEMNNELNQCETRDEEDAVRYRYSQKDDVRISKTIKKLQQQNKELQDKLDKIKTFIKEQMVLGFNTDTNNNIYSVGINNILQIIESSDKDE